MSSIAHAAAVLDGGERLRDRARDHVAVHARHDVERRADHRRVIAHREHVGHPRGRQRAHHARLAQHVVGARRQRRARRAADDALPALAADQVGHVRVPLADRRDVGRPGTERRARRGTARAARATSSGGRAFPSASANVRDDVVGRDRVHAAALRSSGRRGVVRAQLAPRDRHLVHLVGAVGEAQRAHVRVHARRAGSRRETPPPPCTWIARSMTFSATLGRGDLDRRDLGARVPCCRRCPSARRSSA